jgi:hypothetical protein
MGVFEHRTIATEVDAVVTRADGKVKQHIRQVDDLDGNVVVLENESLQTVKKGGFLGGVDEVLMVGLPFGWKRKANKATPYSMKSRAGPTWMNKFNAERIRSGGRNMRLEFLPVPVLTELLTSGIITKDGLGDAAALLVTDVTVPTRFDAIGVGTGTRSAANTQFCLDVESSGSGAARLGTSTTVTGSLVQTSVTGPKNGLADTSQWVGTYSITGTIGLNEVGIFNDTTAVVQTTVSDNPLTSGATTINVASTTGFAASGAGWLTDGTGTTVGAAPEAFTYTGKSGTAFNTSVVRGVYGTSGAAHNQNTLCIPIYGDMLLRQVFASVLNLVNTDSLQLTVKVQHS